MKQQNSRTYRPTFWAAIALLWGIMLVVDYNSAAPDPSLMLMHGLCAAACATIAILHYIFSRNQKKDK